MTKYFPYKVLAYLLYNVDHSVIERTPNGEVILRSGPLSRRLRTTPGRIVKHVEYLHSIGIITQLTKTKRGLYRLALAPIAPYPETEMDTSLL